MQLRPIRHNKAPPKWTLGKAVLSCERNGRALLQGMTKRVEGEVNCFLRMTLQEGESFADGSLPVASELTSCSGP